MYHKNKINLTIDFDIGNTKGLLDINWLIKLPILIWELLVAELNIYMDNVSWLANIFYTFVKHKLKGSVEV